MNWNNLIQAAIFLGALLLLVKPLGIYMARIYEGRPAGLNVWFAPVERWIYRISGINPQAGMSWKTYAVAMMVFNIIGIVVVYALQRFQSYLPAKSDVNAGSAAGFGVQYSGEFCDEYKLAKLRRRNDAQLSYADAGTDGAELCFGGNRYGDTGGSNQGICSKTDRNNRQLLGGFSQDNAIYPAAACA